MTDFGGSGSRRTFADRLLREVDARIAAMGTSSGSLLAGLTAPPLYTPVLAADQLPILMASGPSLRRTLASTVRTYVLGISGGVAALPESLTVAGVLTANGNTVFGDAITDSLTFTARAASDLIPLTTNARSLGTVSLVWANVWATTFTGALTGNATTATTLATARAINGVNFDGSAAITVTAAAGTLTGATLAGNVLASSLTSVGTLLNLTVTNAIAGSVTGSAATITGVYGGTLTSGQVTTALTFTPYNATNPAGYTTNVGTVTSVGGTGTVSGLTLTGTVTTSGSLTLGGTISLPASQVTTGTFGAGAYTFPDTLTSVGTTSLAQSTTSASLSVGTGSGSSFTIVSVRAAAGQFAQVRFMSANLDRWIFYRGNGAESGGDAGSPFSLSAHTDAGVFIDNVLSVVRAAGGAMTTTRPFIAPTGAFSTSVTTPLLTNAGTLALSATGANQITLATNATTRLTVSSAGAWTFVAATITGITAITATTLTGALTGNATTATTLATARVIWGQNFDGSANVTGALSNVTTLAMSGALTGATTGAFSSNVTIGGTAVITGIATMATGSNAEGAAALDGSTPATFIVRNTTVLGLDSWITGAPFARIAFQSTEISGAIRGYVAAIYATASGSQVDLLFSGSSGAVPTYNEGLRISGTSGLCTMASATVTNATILNGTLRANGVAGFGIASSASTMIAVAAGTAAISSMRIPHGVAPTAPVDGDEWSTTAGKFIRVNGVTVGPLAAAGSAAPLTYLRTSFTIGTGEFVIHSRRLQLASTNRLTISGTGRLRLT